MKHPPHEALTHLGQDDLEWLSRFEQRLRQREPQRFGVKGGGGDADDIARSAWERSDWRPMAPEDAAELWLAQRAGS